MSSTVGPTGTPTAGFVCHQRSSSSIDFAEVAKILEEIGAGQGASNTTTNTCLQHYLMTYAKTPGTEGEKLRRQTKYALQSSTPKIFDAIEFVLGAGFLQKEPTILVSDEHVGACSDIGGRDYNEDFCAYDTIAMGSSGIARFYGMYDGHSDNGNCARFVARELPSRLEEKFEHLSLLDHKAITNAIIEVVHDIEVQWREDKGRGGTTATCALEFNGEIYVINIGDSRTVLFKKSKLYQLSEDAKPDDERFRSLVEKMGNTVTPETRDSVARVNGVWALARDFGVPELSPRPKITFLSAADSPINDDPEKGIITYQKGGLLVLTTDGLLDNASNKELEDVLRTMDQKGYSPLEMARLLVQSNVALIPFGGTFDNTTVMVVRL
ncbi:MAG: hypothetical protein K940chlam2_00749 [Chlamydiae bacterium]|nr:hypothetical protein [Chlamydiota bacterium]